METPRIARWLLAALLLCAGGRAPGQILVSNYPSLTNALAASTVVTNFVSGSAITLAAGQTLQISNSVTIDGGTNGIVLDGNGVARIIHVQPNSRLVLNNLQLINGLSANGGAIFNEGVLIVSNSVLSGNSATNTPGAKGGPDPSSGNGGDGAPGGGAAGGAIYSVGPLGVYYCVFGTNTVIAGAGGGGGAGTAGFIFSGNGGNGANGGGALGGAVFGGGPANVFVGSEFIANECFGGAGGAGGPTGQGGLAGNTGYGGAGGPAGGGAVYLTGPCVMSGCLFLTNAVAAGASAAGQVLSDGSGSDGPDGGPAAGGGLCLAGSVTNATLENATFVNNSCAGGAGGAAQNAHAGNGGAASGGGLASSAVLAVARNGTFATNTLAGGAGGTASGSKGAGGAVGAASGWDVCREAGALRLANSILSGGTSLAGNPFPNAAGVTDSGYNFSSDGSLGAATTTTVNYTDPGLAAALSTNGGPAIGPSNITAFATLTLAILNGGPADGAVAGVPGVTYPALDARQLPRGTPASAGACETSARLLVVNTNGTPSITSQPAGHISPLGLSGSLSVTAGSNAGDTNSLGYQWQLGGTNIADTAVFSGANRAALAVRAVNAGDEGDYQVIVSPSLLDGAVTSSVAVLTLPIRPAIKTQPVERLNEPEGGVVTFRVIATGGPPLYYQWRSNNVPINGGSEFLDITNSSLTINPVSFDDAAGYSVVVSNFFRSVTSSVARLTVVPDKTRPAAVITAPAANARVTNSSVFGRASDNAQVTNVVCWVTNEFAGANNPSPINAVLSANGTTVKEWFVTNALLPGTNRVAVQAVDHSGNVSRIVTRHIFRAVPLPLRLSIDGSGTVEGTASVAGNTRPGSNSLLNLGEGYALRAKSDVGSVFLNWVADGATNLSNPLRFVMTSNLAITANFMTNPFIAVAGTYNGLFFDPAIGVTEQTVGMLRNLSISARGVYSGRLLLAGSAYPFSGGLTLSCSASKPVVRPAGRGGPVQLSFQWTNGVIAGSVSGTDQGGWTNTLRAVMAESSASPAAYTLLLAPPTNSGAPPGSGYALLTNHNAHLTLTGALADGTPFSQSVPIAASGDVPLYASLYGNRGLLLGWINVAGGVPAGGTNFVWIRPAGGAGLYASGFTCILDGQESAWTGATAFPFSTGTLTVTNGALYFTNEVSLSSNTLVSSSGSSNFLSGTINPKTGALKVSFSAGAGGATITGYGACSQEATNAAGYFITKTSAGAIFLTPSTN